MKLVVSTTRVSPSQRPTESPSQLRILGRRVLLVHPHHARVVDHLDEDEDGVVGLDDALQVVVEHRQHRRPRRRAEPHQAPLGERTLLGVVVGARRVQIVLEPPRRPRVRPHVGGGVGGARGPRLRGHRGLPAVGRVGDDGGSPLAVDLEPRGAAVHPERVVAAHVAGRAGGPVAAHRGRLARGLGLDVPFVGDVEDALEGLAAGRERGRLLLGQGQRLAVLHRALQRRQGGDVVGPRQVRPAVGPARNVLSRLRESDRRREGQGEKPATQSPQSHRRCTSRHRCLQSGPRRRARSPRARPGPRASPTVYRGCGRPNQSAGASAGSAKTYTALVRSPPVGTARYCRPPTA